MGEVKQQNKLIIHSTYKNMKKITKLEILNETIAFYNGDVNRRSKIADNCVYNGYNGEHCAVGRCMLPEFKEQGVELKGNIGQGLKSLAIINDLAFDKMLEEQYRGHEVDFWVELQHLHDNEIFWDNAGLNVVGENFTNEICKKYNLVS
jgi:hypothetical protein